MPHPSSRLLPLALVSVTLVSGCVPRIVARHTGESIVLIGEQPAFLAFPIYPGQPIAVRSTYLDKPATIHFTEGADYLVDRELGTVRRTPTSRLPDFRKNSLFAQENFDHSKFPGFGNNAFFAYADYSFQQTVPWPAPPSASQIPFLKHAESKLRSGQPFKLVAFGDSITAGGDASQPDLIFWQRWAARLQQKYPAAKITAVNGATGGDTTVQGLQRLQAKVLQEKPELVLIGFGMNDHNLGGPSIPQFEKNLELMIEQIRRQTSADILLFSTFPPNPKWKYGTHHMQDYAAATAAVALRNHCAYADVFNNWQTIAARKKPEDLLANNVNHPNDFGHWIYFRVLQSLNL